MLRPANANSNDIEFRRYMGLFFFITIILLVIVEIYLSGSWIPVYFQNGIPLFRKTFSHLSELNTEIIANILSEESKPGCLAPTMCFRRLNSNEIAFRERLFNFTLFSYTPVMHGIIRFNHSPNTVSMIGYANWVPLLFTLVFVGNALFGLVWGGFRSYILLFIIFPLFLFGALYGIQYYVFGKIFERIRREYSFD